MCKLCFGPQNHEQKQQYLVLVLPGWKSNCFSFLLQHAHPTETSPYQRQDLRGQLIFNANITIWYHSNWGYCGSSGWVKLLMNFCWCEWGGDTEHRASPEHRNCVWLCFVNIKIINKATYNAVNSSMCDKIYELMMRFAWGMRVYSLGTAIKTKAVC